MMISRHIQLLLLAQTVRGVVAFQHIFGGFGPRTTLHSTLGEDYEDYVGAETDEKELREVLKEELASLAFRTERGFKASSEERQEARKLIFELAEYNPTSEPAAAFYAGGREEASVSAGLCGKWTLVYTDAPDITGLDQNNFAVLGRIGQECEPPYIRNVIEWLRPSWADLLPFAGTEPSARVIQKVVTEAEASPSKPLIVDLKLVGLQIETDDDDDDDKTSQAGTAVAFRESLERKGLLRALLSRAPINLQGSLKAPFGEFEVLYLDEDFRILRTGQNRIAVNRRITDEGTAWF